MGQIPLRLNSCDYADGSRRLIGARRKRERDREQTEELCIVYEAAVARQLEKQDSDHKVKSR